jgi:ribonuclease HI
MTLRCEQLRSVAAAAVTLLHASSPTPAGIAAFAQSANECTTSQHRIGQTTDDRAAVFATIEALRLCPPGCTVELQPPSRRVAEVLSTNALSRWQDDGWKARVGRRPIKNEDLWRVLVVEVEARTVKVACLKTHSYSFNYKRLQGMANDALDGLISFHDPLYLPGTATEHHRIGRVAKEGGRCGTCRRGDLRQFLFGSPIGLGPLQVAWILVCDVCGGRRLDPAGYACDARSESPEISIVLP